jgi:hypothetical protein
MIIILKFICFSTMNPNLRLTVRCLPARCMSKRHQLTLPNSALRGTCRANFLTMDALPQSIPMKVSVPASAQHIQAPKNNAARQRAAGYSLGKMTVIL